MVKQVASRTSTTSRKKSSPPAAHKMALVAAEPSQAAIEARAYGLYLARGAHEGDAFGDWVQAERELRAQARS